MNSLTISLAALLIGTTASFAAEAWKEAEVGGTKIYTNPKGMTLYTFDKDEKGVSNCNGKCATNWPPLKAAASAKDEKAGDMKGDGAMGMWHVAKAQ